MTVPHVDPIRNRRPAGLTSLLVCSVALSAWNAPGITATRESAYARALLANTIASLPKGLPSHESAVVDSFLARPFDPAVRAPSTAELKATLQSIKANVGQDRTKLGTLFGVSQTTENSSPWLPSSTVLITGLRNFVVARTQDELALALLTEMNHRLPLASPVRTALPE